MGQRKRDDTRAGVASAKVVPLRPASIRDDLPTGYLEQVARRVRANLTDLVATADTYDLDLATEFRIAAELLQKASGTSHPLQIAESTGLRLTNGTGGCWELVDHDGNVLGLIVAVDGRLVLAPTSDRLERVQGSCYLALGDSAKAGWILEGTARRLQGRHKSKAIILGNLALAHVRQREVEQAATVLHRAIDLLEVSRGGGGLNVVSAAVRELRPWRHEPVVQDVNERLLALMTLN